MIFDVDAEHHTAASAASIGHGIVANAREAHLVSRRTAWFRTAKAVTRIAQSAFLSRADDARAGITFARQAGALQAVEVTGMEVAIQAGPEVTDMFPFTLDAR